MGWVQLLFDFFSLLFLSTFLFKEGLVFLFVGAKITLSVFDLIESFAMDVEVMIQTFFEGAVDDNRPTIEVIFLHEQAYINKIIGTASEMDGLLFGV